MIILIVDGSDSVRETLIRYLGLEKIFNLVFEASTVKEAKRIMNSIKIDLVLLDIQLPDQSGLAFVNYCNRQTYKPLIIVCSNYGLPQYKNVYEKLAIDQFFDKSSELPALKKYINKLVKYKKKYFSSLYTNKRVHKETTRRLK
ncbi:MAG: response regulator [Bacteroidota bacterium]|jgi:response regulator of citrate/malate metabolism